jgi:hypothetical protein
MAERTSFDVYLLQLYLQGQMLSKAYVKAARLDSLGALDARLAFDYYLLRNATYMQTVSVVKGFKELAGEVNSALPALVPMPTLGPDLPRTPSTLTSPSEADIEPVSLGLGVAAVVVPVEAVVATILGVAALAAVASVLYIGMEKASQLAASYALTRSYTEMLAKREKLVDKCIARGQDPATCAQSAVTAYPTPDAAISDSLENVYADTTPWYLRPTVWMGVAAVGAIGYVVYRYTDVASPMRAPRLSGVAGNLPLPKQLQLGERSASSYGLEV